MTNIDINLNLYLTAFEKMADAVLLLNAKDERFINCNEAALKLFAYPNKTAFLNQKPADISPTHQTDGKSSSQKTTESYALAKQTGFHRFDWQYLKHDGSTFSAEVTLTPIIVEEEEIFHITLRELSEHILRELTERIQIPESIIKNIMAYLESEKTNVASMSIDQKIQELNQHTGPTELKGLKILIVEDDAFMQEVITELLERFGATFIVANNGAEALEALEKDQFDAVLMDLHMPLMDGFVATLQIRKIEKFANLPIIAVTASVSEEAKQRCLRTGMNDFISKPINVSKLLSKITSLTKVSE
ncbi:MAG: response regulator [Methylococcales bacterium]